MTPSADKAQPWIIDTHAFAFSPVFVAENGLPADLDGTFDALAEDMRTAGVANAIATLFVTHQDDRFESVAQGLERHRPRIAAQVNIPPNHPKWAAENLRAAASDKDVAGARAALAFFEMHPDDARLAAVWDACESSRLPLQLVVDNSPYCDPSGFRRLAKERPGLAIVLSLTEARPQASLKELGRVDSIYFQVPGLLDSEERSRRPEMLVWATKNLPAERVMFGSDRLGREEGYSAKVGAVKGLAPKLRQWVGRDTALAVYGARQSAWKA